MASDLRAWLLPNANEQSPGNIKRGLILQIRKAIAPQLGYGYDFWSDAKISGKIFYHEIKTNAVFEDVDRTDRLVLTEVYDS